MFLDYVELEVVSGKGGDGAVAFRREKFVPRGGPAGGDGGKGGSVIIRADASLRTLVDFRYRHHFKAGSGFAGGGGRRTGADGKDLFILVPPGTVLRIKNGPDMADLKEAGDQLVVAKGGRGGLGNARFATPVCRAPRKFTPGRPGKTLSLVLELKMLADAGLVGYPNSGKSTLLSVISRAHPKIAPYPFSTLEPSLGLVMVAPGNSFVAADIPGLIAGAHQGKGLGHAFLRHIERTATIMHLVDVSQPGAPERYREIRAELEQFGRGLAQKPEIVVATKMDMPGAAENLALLRGVMAKEGRPVFPVSALRHEGLLPLLQAVSAMITGSQSGPG